MLDSIGDAIGKATNSVESAASSATNTVKGAAAAVGEAATSGAAGAAFTIAEKHIKETYGYDIDFKGKNIPVSWMEWICKTGINSICNDQTWGWLSDPKKKAHFEERGITTIYVSVNENPDEDMSGWVVADVKWDMKDPHEATIEFYPRAQNWESDNSWLEEGYKRWWNLCDELVFGLQLYQLDGKCFYKSDWLDGVSDPDETATLPGQTKKFKRWFQFRHWIIYWYPKARWGWNWQWTTTPPPLPDGSLFNLDACLSLPGMPNFEMPKLKLPSMPGITMPSMPDAPSLPNAPSMPSLSAPSLSAPSISAPDLSAPNLSMPKQPKRPDGRWSCHGYIELDGLNVCNKGNKVIFSDAKITHFWKADNGHGVKTETKEHSRMELQATNEAQARSWVESLVAAGVKEGEVAGCCCTVA